VKKLFLVRHASAEDTQTYGGDFARALTAKGVAQAEKVGTKLKEYNLKPDLILSSTAKRAKETAEIILKKLNIVQEELKLEQSIYESSSEDLFSLISETDDTYQSLLIFGHNPTFYELTDYLCKHDLDDFPKCGAVGIEFNYDSWSEIRKKTGKLFLYVNPKTI